MFDTAQALNQSMKPKFAVSYLRVSTRGQAERGGGHDEGFSIPAQREANKRKAMSMGAMIGKEFVDRGASAKSADRPQLQAMLEYVKENAARVDYVIVHKVDRLARNRGDDVDIMRILRECGVQLVSASESIDDTPAGMLLHGIMSSIAEFYSQNLANEVRKGMNEKVKNGGTAGKAPIGYINVRRIDEKGREDRSVEIDEERAPLIKLAFEEYATGKWSLVTLTDYMNACGLNTRATPRIPSNPMTRSSMEKILTNPYYKGVVVYNGIEYNGTHPKLVDPELWDAVQAMLASRVNGERTREHPHFLKGSIYCGECGSRMIVTYAKNHAGVVYPYFVCAGRHNKRVPCKLKSVLIDAVERQIEQIYHRYSITPEVREALEAQAKAAIKSEYSKVETEMDGLKREKEKLERKRKKLMESYYSDAITVDFLKSEQTQINKQLAAIEHEINAHGVAFEAVEKNLSAALELMENCGEFYRMAPDNIKRMINQAMVKRFLISSNGNVTAELNEPYPSITEPFRREITKYKNARGTATGIKKFLIPDNSPIFLANCLNKELLVEATRHRLVSRCRLYGLARNVRLYNRDDLNFQSSCFLLTLVGPLISVVIIAGDGTENPCIITARCSFLLSSLALSFRGRKNRFRDVGGGCWRDASCNVHEKRPVGAWHTERLV